MENKELNQEELEKVSGGADPATCPHTYGWDTQMLFRQTGEVNDAGYTRCIKCRKYFCRRCGKSFWEDQLPK